MKFIKKHIYTVYGLVFSVAIMLIVLEVSYSLEYQRIEKKVSGNLQLNHRLSISSIISNLRALQEEVQLLASNKQINEYILNAQNDLLAVESFDDWSTKIVSHFEYHDLLLINANGDIIYSVAKEKDLGTNLVDGPFSNTGLAELYKVVMDSGHFSGSDFSVYEPSNNDLAAFVGAPVYKNDVIIGMIVIQVPTSFERLNIGVHIEHIEDFIITSDYFFSRNGEFESIDKIGFKISKEPDVIKSDSLFLFTPFKVRNLNWGILSVAPPVVFKSLVRWSRIWYYSIIAFLTAQVLFVIALFQFRKSKKALKYIESEAVLVQNSWTQLNKKSHSFGTDFYYRIKNKSRIDLKVEKGDIDNLGELIESKASKIIASLLDKDELNANLLGMAKVCYQYNISASQVRKLPNLFLESFEDELGKEVPIRAKFAWQKILKSMSHSIVGLLKSNAKMN